MSIAIHCDHCDKDMKVKDSLEGQRGLCPHCNSEIQVPFLVSEKLRVKMEREPEVKLPTEKQINFAHSLGIDVPPNMNRYDLSKLIDKAKENAASECQKEFLMEHVTVEQLFKELQNRGKSFVAFVLKDGEITCHDKFPPGELHWSDDLGEEDIKFILLMLNKHWVKDFDTAKSAENFEGLVNPFDLNLRLSVRHGNS
jgi:hypothetical protein